MNNSIISDLTPSDNWFEYINNEPDINNWNAFNGYPHLIYAIFCKVSDYINTNYTHIIFTELDFRGKFQKFDVMTEIGIDHGLLSNLEELNRVLKADIKSRILPIIKEKDKAKKIDGTLDKMNEKQMIDCMIEQLIEKRCDKPGFIMNHPMVMSPLAKSHA